MFLPAPRDISIWAKRPSGALARDGSPRVGNRRQTLHLGRRESSFVGKFVRRAIESGDRTRQTPLRQYRSSSNPKRGEDGHRYLYAGWRNEYSAGIMAVINEKKPFAASPQTPGTRHQWVSCPTGAPDEYFVFPGTTVNRVEGLYEDTVREIAVDGNRIQVSDLEAGPIQPCSRFTCFVPTRPCAPSRCGIHRPKTCFTAISRREEIPFPLADSPGRLHPLPISVWTPSGGWADYAVRPPGIALSKPRPISKPPRYVPTSVPEP